jgi:hypothetical protein
MTTAEILRRVQIINEMSSDDEAAHILEDKLHQDVLRAIVNGEAESPVAEMAAAALKTQVLTFKRRCS